MSRAAGRGVATLTIVVRRAIDMCESVGALYRVVPQGRSRTWSTAPLSHSCEDSNEEIRREEILFFRFRGAGDFAVAAAIQYYGLSALARFLGKSATYTMSDDRRSDDDLQTGVVVKTKPKTKKPSMYKVLLLNDDYTPMEFVVHVLERFFGKSRQEATQIMLHVHRRGVGICGVYTYEVAETKVTQVIDFARRHQHPLQCTMEKE
jgi:ATP-dependent Clp protease adaptor protein ClpS